MPGRYGFSRLPAGSSWRAHRRDEAAQRYAFQQFQMRKRAHRFLMAHPNRRALLSFLKKGKAAENEFARSLYVQFLERGSLSARQLDVVLRSTVKPSQQDQRTCNHTEAHSFLMNHPERRRMLAFFRKGKMGANRFAKSLYHQLCKRGSLSDKQVACILKGAPAYTG